MNNPNSINDFSGTLVSDNNFVGYITNTGVVFDAKMSSDGKIGPPGPEGPPGPQGPEGDIDEDEVIDIVEENTPSLSNMDVLRIFRF